MKGGFNTDIFPKIIIAIMGGLLLYCYGFHKGNNSAAETVRTDTLFIERWDTVTIEKPTEIVRYVVRHDTIRTNEIVIITDSATNEPQAIIPIEQSVYSDSTKNAQYTAFVSGFHAALDSINIFCKNTETIITNEVRLPSPRISVGVQAGVGVSLQGLAVPYVGLGVQYRLWGK